MRQIRAIVIHCSATPNGDARFKLEDLARMHKERGWAMIGYHHVIEVDGSSRTGRPETQIGAHVAGSNADSIGVCMVGTNRFSPAQWETLRELVSSLKLKFPDASVWGHRDYSPDKDGDGVIEEWEWFKLCPGFEVGAWQLSGMDPEWNEAHILRS